MLNRQQITDLPDDILIHVFICLTTKDLAAIVLVCKEWNQVASDPYLWKKSILKNNKRRDLNEALVKEIRGNGNSKLFLRYCLMGADANTQVKAQDNKNDIEKKYSFRVSNYGFFKQVSLLSLAANYAEYSHQIDNIKTLLKHGADPMRPSSFIEYRGTTAHNGLTFYRLHDQTLYEPPVDSALNKRVKIILLEAMIKIAAKNNRPNNEIERLNDQYRKLQSH